MYNIPIADLVKWNGITDVRNVSVGMKLVVAKSDPNRPTPAEEHAENQKKIMKVCHHSGPM
jgi:LysM repeat protein